MIGSIAELYQRALIPCEQDLTARKDGQPTTNTKGGPMRRLFITAAFLFVSACGAPNEATTDTATGDTGTDPGTTTTGTTDADTTDPTSDQTEIAPGCTISEATLCWREAWNDANQEVIAVFDHAESDGCDAPQYLSALEPDVWQNADMTTRQGATSSEVLVAYRFPLDGAGSLPDYDIVQFRADLFDDTGIPVLSFTSDDLYDDAITECDVQGLSN